MPKKSSKPKRGKKEVHPTLFVFQSSIRYYDNGSMLELHSQVSNEEWQRIIEETIAYKLYVECLKEYVFPQLDEQWTSEDDWYRVQLGVAVSRMKNIDPLLVAKYDQKQIKQAYLDSMKSSVLDINKLIGEFKSEIESSKITKVTDL